MEHAPERASEENANSPDFAEYLRVREPHTRARAYAWKAAIGLQAVDGLSVSEYLKKTARRHIEGKISIDEARDLVRSYYRARSSRRSAENENQEADKVAVNIAELLGEQSFSFSVPGFVSTHRRIFEGVFDHAGTFRDFDITKKEWVLRGDTVLYASFEDLARTLEYDIGRERQFSYSGLGAEETVLHIAKFVSGLWQIHPFREGNTRTTAIFAVKYLRSVGFNVDNELFERNSWYFRNALVRANYRNVQKGISPNFEFLIRFFRNLLLGEKNELKNRILLVGAPEAERYPASIPASIPASSDVGANVRRLVAALGNSRLSMKEMMSAAGLKDRENFRRLSLCPAIEAGLVALLYPGAPRHPRQKYFLTENGLRLFREK